MEPLGNPSGRYLKPKGDKGPPEFQELPLNPEAL